MKKIILAIAFTMTASTQCLADIACPSPVIFCTGTTSKTCNVPSGWKIDPVNTDPMLIAGSYGFNLAFVVVPSPFSGECSYVNMPSGHIVVIAHNQRLRPDTTTGAWSVTPDKLYAYCTEGGIAKCLFSLAR